MKGVQDVVDFLNHPVRQRRAEKLLSIKRNLYDKHREIETVDLDDDHHTECHKDRRKLSIE